MVTSSFAHDCCGFRRTRRRRCCNMLLSLTMLMMSAQRTICERALTVRRQCHGGGNPINACADTYTTHTHIYIQGSSQQLNVTF